MRIVQQSEACPQVTVALGHDGIKIAQKMKQPLSQKMLNLENLEPELSGTVGVRLPKSCCANMKGPITLAKGQRLRGIQELRRIQGRSSPFQKGKALWLCAYFCGKSESYSYFYLEKEGSRKRGACVCSVLSSLKSGCWVFIEI